MSEFIELMVVTPTKGASDKLHVEPNAVRRSDIETISIYHPSPRHLAEFGEKVRLSKVILGRPYSEEEMKERIAERAKHQPYGSNKPPRPPSTKPILTVLEPYESLRDRLGAEPAPEEA